ncbi:ribokinase [Actinopolymorpha cephalotaxi]|uniref:Ribokinase n=1 Tax=Actinopolymorpha cephalotaxi TaxID=504797 RepID=A0A1I2PRV7_9ACTN|nr:carbohydrate kinase family protein [Actinopolymorpha cephalotaxi]NYH83499.1 ribokinase [Actinopolymorpha cephalotaxi]SFG18798.1 ribokinase [Actinopolymorpha cephalotaxi]
MIAVVGHTCVETTVPDGLLGDADAFGEHVLSTSVSGVGVNVASALHTLGQDVRFASVVGQDLLGDVCVRTLAARGLDPTHVVRATPATAQSLVRYDPDGRRRNLVDLKDVQRAAYPPELVPGLLADVRLAVLGTIGYARPLLAEARERGVPVAADVQAVSGPDDAYNRDWLAGADLLFASHERLDLPPGDFVAAQHRRHGTAVVVVGLGADGALLGVRGEPPVHVPAVRTRAVVSTVGAGDALFAAFLDGWSRGLDPRAALSRAAYFASWKVGAAGGAAGFLDRDGLDALVAAGP